MYNYNEALSVLEQQGNLRQLPTIEQQQKYLSTPNQQQMLNLSSNDYLGLASDAAMQADFINAIQSKALPFSSSSSRLLTGNYPIYAALESLMGERFGGRSALLFNSGYHANLGILPAVSTKQTLILADKLVHASIIDGMKLAGCAFVRYRHNDMEHLEQLLKKETNRYEQYIIVTESIFSMDGDVADLNTLVQLKARYQNVMLYVDEAHAIGAYGKSGLGIAEVEYCIEQIDFLVGTFGKALASVGAYVICSETIKQYLINTMRPLIFSTALPPINVAWSYYLFEKLPQFTVQRTQLAAVSGYFRTQLAERGVLTPSQSHIIPYIVGDNEACMQQALQLQKRGFYVLPVRPPTVPVGTARLRFSFTASIQENEINQLIAAL